VKQLWSLLVSITDFPSLVAAILWARGDIPSKKILWRDRPLPRPRNTKMYRFACKFFGGYSPRTPHWGDRTCPDPQNTKMYRFAFKISEVFRDISHWGDHTLPRLPSALHAFGACSPLERPIIQPQNTCGLTLLSTC